MPFNIHRKPSAIKAFLSERVYWELFPKKIEKFSHSQSATTWERLCAWKHNATNYQVKNQTTYLIGHKKGREQYETYL